MNKSIHYFVYILFITFLCTACSYFQSYQQQAQKKHIKNQLSTASLFRVNEFTSRTPYHKTLEFELNNSKSSDYALIFYISESSFSKSIIKYRLLTDLHRDAVRIDDSKEILHRLNTHLPNAGQVIWAQVANDISEEDARDGYHILREFIRHKLRDL